jgi:voltage-gated hydrogen channel 1
VSLYKKANHSNRFCSYLSSWFHCFDAAIILASFVVDLLSHGVIEEIASLVIILRLFRLVKIVEEVSLGAVERMESIQAELERLRSQNEELKRRLEGRGEDDLELGLS